MSSFKVVADVAPYDLDKAAVEAKVYHNGHRIGVLRFLTYTSFTEFAAALLLTHMQWRPTVTFEVEESERLKEQVSRGAK